MMANYPKDLFEHFVDRFERNIFDKKINFMAAKRNCLTTSLLVTSSRSLYPLISTNPAFGLCMWIELMIKHVLNMIEISTWMNVFEHDHTFHHGFPRRSCLLDFSHFKIDEFLTTNEPRLDTVYDVDNRAHIHGTAWTTVLLKFNVSLYGMICQMNIIIKIVKIKILAFYQFKLWNSRTRSGDSDFNK